MKKILCFLVLILFLILTITACGNKAVEEKVLGDEIPELTLEKVIELSKKGNELSWKDFERYVSIEIGSGLYIRRYDIDENYYLLIGGGSIDEKPMYIYLVKANNPDNYIDIRIDNISSFISK